MWFWYALVSAILVGIATAMSKRVLARTSTAIVTFALFAFSLPLLFVWLIWQGFPQVTPHFFLFATLSGIVFVISKLIELRAVKQQSLSEVYPLIAFSSVFTYIFGIFVFSEIATLASLLGLFVIVFGAYVLNVSKIKEGIFEPIKELYKNPHTFIVIVAMVLAAVSSIFDKAALLNIEQADPYMMLLVVNIVQTVLVMFYIFKKKISFFKEIKQHFTPLFFMSLIYVLGGVAIFLVFAQGPVALASAIKRTQIPWLFGILFFWRAPVEICLDSNDNNAYWPNLY